MIDRLAIISALAARRSATTIRVVARPAMREVTVRAKPAKPAPVPRPPRVRKVGSCTRCHTRDAAEGRKRCTECIVMSRSLESRNAAAGKCRCGRAREAGLSECAKCREVREQLRAKSIAEGICLWARSHGPAAPGRTLCEGCLRRAREYQERRRADRRAA